MSAQDKLVITLGDGNIDINGIVDSDRLIEMIEDIFGCDVSSSEDVSEQICHEIAEIVEKKLQQHTLYHVFSDENSFGLTTEPDDVNDGDDQGSDED